MNAPARKLAFLPLLFVTTTAGFTSIDPGVIALMIPIVAIVMGGILKLAKIRAGGVSDRLPAEAEERMGVLEQEVGAMRQELAETQERLDFAERILANRPPQELPPQ